MEGHTTDSLYNPPACLYTALVRTIPPLLLALVCCCCSSPGSPGSTAPASLTAGQETLPFFGTRSEANKHLQQVGRSCPPRITLHVVGGLDEAFCDNACALLNRQVGAWCHQYRAIGNEVSIDINYTDYCLMLAVHEGHMPVSRLSAEQARAYSKAQQIVAEAKAAHRDDYGLALALHDRIVINSSYRESVSDGNHVCGILLHGSGLCESYAGTYYLLARMAGLDCRYVIGFTKETRHAWNIVRLNGQWTHVDCTYDDPLPDLRDKPLRHYFGMNDATIAQSHRWERGNYPACTSDKLWYMTRHSQRFATLDAMAAALVARAEKEGGSPSMDGYVEELARDPQRASALLQAAVHKHRRSLSLEQSSGKATAGFVTLSCH